MSIDEKEDPPINYQCPHCKLISKAPLMTELFELKNKEIKLLKNQVLALKFLVQKIKSIIQESRL